jgi:hypothetical protein
MCASIRQWLRGASVASRASWLADVAAVSWMRTGAHAANAANAATVIRIAADRRYLLHGHAGNCVASTCMRSLSADCRRGSRRS